ncbi:hypothetical protein P154DRAFT_598655 [Amniculicola lignicola CBS 123094]|uniref:Heterokaryon incompatibility domain-containing protein n=1 Tax=Amniculicola lignicola CBS 123094 TaxID=1392246 RepID=A0A6A5WFC6_9PLEO|nr:hypothetical protein P154DRAFT_598655 [Amniculicola lignicola CBS 123094]
MGSLGPLKMWSYGLVMLAMAHTVTAAALQNITLPLPAGTSNHGTPGLLCTPTKWTDLASFYLFNYVAHAATVIILPGERSIDFAVSVVGCLLFPALGLYRGVGAILCGAVFERNDLRKAAKSGALCMVVRSPDWRPVDGESVGNAVVRRKYIPVTRGDDTAQEKDTQIIPYQNDVEDEADVHVVIYSPPWIRSQFGSPHFVHRQVIHGTHTLPPGYQYAIIPPSAQFTASSKTTIEIASTYNFVKVLAALAQTGYASLTLYRSRGDQIERFGYAAFGLTVAPYAVMSVMNLIGNLCRPDYASLYLVDTSIMDEARRRGGNFEGTVARLEEEADPSICSCQVSNTVDIEDLVFTNDGFGNMRACFNTTSPPITTKQPASEPDTLSSSITSKTANHISQRPDPLAWQTWPTQSPSSPSKSSSSTLNSGLTPHTYRLSAPLPKNDHATTEKDSLLLLPSCNPLRLTPHQPLPEDPSPRWMMSSITLTKCNYHWFAKISRYVIAFHPHIYTPATHSRPLLWRWIRYLLTFFIGLLPVLIIGLLSQFQKGSAPKEDSENWKAYTMQWLAFGVVSGLWWVLDQEVKDGSEVERFKVGPAVRFISRLPGRGENGTREKKVCREDIPVEGRKTNGGFRRKTQLGNSGPSYVDCKEPRRVEKAVQIHCSKAGVVMMQCQIPKAHLFFNRGGLAPLSARQASGRRQRAPSTPPKWQQMQPKVTSTNTKVWILRSSKFGYSRLKRTRPHLRHTAPSTYSISHQLHRILPYHTCGAHSLLLITYYSTAGFSEVRDNLCNFLCTFQTRTAVTTDVEYIFIDQICINQNDIQEKHAQVKLMSNTSSMAALVVTWLGIDPKIIESARNYLNEPRDYHAKA